MKLTRLMRAGLLPLALGATAAIAGAQGKGKGGGQGDDKDKGKGRDKQEVAVKVRGDQARRDDKIKVKVKDDDRNKGKGNKKDRDDVAIVSVSGGNVSFREFAVSPKRGRRMAGLAVASAVRRGDNDDAFVIVPVDNRVQVKNRKGEVLVDFDDDRELGNWKVVSEPFKDKKGAPSFCRSGSGHPVWGRQWCIDKGFGLGADGDRRWSRVLDPSNVVIARRTTGDLTRDVLLDVLGSVVLNRLATHAVTLGYQDPLTGRWIGEQADTGPRVLLLTSGSRPVAEIVDLNRDDRADLLLVTVRR
jgi:hypothetical protein